MPFDNSCGEDTEINQTIHEIWEPERWELAVKLTGDSKILFLAEIIRSKLVQSRFHLKNILYFDIETGDTESFNTSGADGGRINNQIIQYELESLLYILNRILDLLAALIAIIYGIHIPDGEVHFQDFFPRSGGGNHSKSFLIFNELRRKDTILAGQLSAFYFSEENRLLLGCLQHQHFSNPFIPVKYVSQPSTTGHEIHADSFSTQYKAGIFDAGSVIMLEKTYREAVCKFGRIIFNHLNYQPILIHYFSGYQALE